MTPLQPPTPLPQTHTLLAQAIKRAPARAAVTPIAVKSDTWLHGAKAGDRDGKLRSNVEKRGRIESNALFIAVCCLLCLALLPSFPTIQILPFSLCHLSEVRMGMTQQGHCFVVLFYLFLDNEKSAEGLAWCLSPHIYTHETLSRPYGSSTGGYLTLLTLWHQKHGSRSFFFRRLSRTCANVHPG